MTCNFLKDNLCTNDDVNVKRCKYIDYQQICKGYQTRTTIYANPKILRIERIFGDHTEFVASIVAEDRKLQVLFKNITYMHLIPHYMSICCNKVTLYNTDSDKIVGEIWNP